MFEDDYPWMGIMTQKPQGQPVPRYLGGDGHNIAPESEWPKHGVTDLTNAIDSRSKAVLAAEDFAACEIRCHMLHGQWVAELERLKELSLALDTERDAAVKRVQEAGR